MAQRVVLLVGTRKGAFVISSDPGRRDWTIEGPRCEGYPIHDMTMDPATGRAWAAGGSPWYGPTVFTSDDLFETWTQSSSGLAYGPDAEPIPTIWSLGRSNGTLYAGVEPAGLFRSDDEGRTWQHVEGLTNHPSRPTWQPGNGGLILHTIVSHPSDPRRMWVGISAVGVFETRDGGETWETRNRGVVAVGAPDPYPETGQCVHKLVMAAGRPERLYQQNHSGVYRSDDGGETWKQLSSDTNLTGRPWYFNHIRADPNDADTVWVLNFEIWKSIDGGTNWQVVAGPHADYQDIWFDPEDSDRIILGHDGGACVSLNGGESWSSIYNQPTGEFYHASVDNRFPYRVYGAQQDNSTVRILHRTDGFSISEADWQPTAGGESGHLAVDPTDEDVVFGGSYDGFLTRRNHRTGEERGVNVWPDNPMGHGAEGAKYRFQWNFPIFFSPHDPKKLYAASQHLHVSTNGGQTWEIISPDLTRNDPTKLGPSGGPITKDNTAVEYYCTIFAVAESPYEKNLVIAGSDDGVLSITRDGGKNWEKITPPSMPEWSMISPAGISRTHHALWHREHPCRRMRSSVSPCAPSGD